MTSLAFASQEKETGFIKEKKLCTEGDELTEQDIAAENEALSSASMNEVDGGKKQEPDNPAGSLCGWNNNPYGLPPIHLGDPMGSPAGPQNPLSNPNNTDKKKG